MQYTVDEVNSVKKTIRFEFPETEIAKELDTAYNELKKSAKVKGFRKGKVPRAVLERRFGKDVNADITQKLIQESLIQAIRETEMNIIGNPQIDSPELATGGDYTYTSTVEIKPEIGEIDYKGIKVTKNMYSVSDEEIDAQLQMLQKNMAQMEKIEEDRALQEGDFALIDYEGFQNGTPHPEAQKTENFTLKIGDGHILKEFDDAIVGMNPGEEREIKIQFPEDYFNQNMGGQEIDFKVNLKDIRQEVLPQIDDELAKKVGEYQNMEELKNAIVTNLEEGYTKRTEQELNEQIFQELIDRTDFEVPDALVEYELEGIMADAERSFSYHNMTLEQVGLTRETMAEKYRDTALRQVKRHLILDRIVEQEKMELADNDLDQAFEDMSKAFNQPGAEIRKYYDANPDKLDFFKHTLLEKKAIQLIMDSSDIEEIVPEKETPEKTGADKKSE